MIKRIKTVSIMLLLMGLPAGAAYAETHPIETIEIVQQSSAATGTVVDATGEPLTGASVIVKGTTKGAMVDNDGKFSIAGVKQGQTLRVSFIGYVAQEVKWEGQPLNIVLEEDNNALGEVVVTAMGIKKDAKKLGYSVSTIKSDELTTTASPNLGTALYGKAAGVRIQTAPGGAAGAITVNVRGLSSITGTNQPLIVIDGVPIHNGDTNNSDYWGSQRTQSNGLADINPEDIENLSILKGAAASALYGSEAANGVVMITTKSGKGASGIGVDFNASVTGNLVAYMPTYQTTFGPGTFTENRLGNSNYDEDGFYYREDRHGNRQMAYAGTTQYFGPRYDANKTLLYFDGTQRPYDVINENPWKEVFRTGIDQQYNIGITKGGEKGNMRFSYTYLNSRPNQYNSNFKKHNFSLTGSYSVLDNVKLDYTVNYLHQDIKNRPYRMARLTSNFGGMFGPYDDVAYLREHAVTQAGYMNRTWSSAQHENPEEGWEFYPNCGAVVDEYFWNILGREQYENNNRLIASVTPSWEIIKGLTLRGRAATDLTFEGIELQEHNDKALTFGNSGYYKTQNNRYSIVYGDIMLMFDRQLTENFGLQFNVGWQGREEQMSNVWANTDGGLTVENWFHLNASKNTVRGGQQVQSFLKTAWLGTLTFQIARWGFLEGTVRQEKISTLAKDNNSFFYPSINASVLLNELVENCPTWWNYGKARLSYGIVGNAPEIYKATQAYTQASASGFVYNAIGGSVGNNLIQPEKKYEWEIGLEGKFLGNRLGFEASYYNARIKDQILQTTMPYSAGGTSILMNIGELHNQGFELSVYGTPVRVGDWKWDLRANIAWNRNEVTKLNEGVDHIDHKNWDNGSLYLRSFVGGMMGDFYSLAPATDENGNYIINSDGLYKLTNDWVKVGNAMPKLTGGFATDLTWREWTLGISLDFRVGGAVWNQPYQYMMGRGAIKESLDFRGVENGGLLYYVNDANELVHIASAAEAPAGKKVYDDGMILDGVREDGTKNTQLISAGKYYVYTYNWGGYDPSDVTYYSHSVFDNSYVKVREITLGYSFPKRLIEKFHCKNLSLSVFARNPFYIYKNLPILDAESTDATSWIEQSYVGNSSATTRSFGASLRVSF